MNHVWSGVNSLIVWKRVGLEENQVGYLPTQAKTRLEWATHEWRAVQVHAGLMSWATLRRPGTPGQVPPVELSLEMSCHSSLPSLLKEDVT